VIYLVQGTPLENHRAEFGLLVKREDLSCPPPGPPFSKTRGVLAYAEARMAEGVRTLGVLDTVHSQGGWAVAHACSVLGLRCINFYPQYKADKPGHLRPFQLRAAELGAELRPLPAGRSAILFHQAKRQTEAEGGHMYPNALKLPQTVEETAREVRRTFAAAEGPTLRALSSLPWIVSASSGTVAAGVLRGLNKSVAQTSGRKVRLVVHMGYDRPTGAVTDYILKAAGHFPWPAAYVEVVNEGYAYADVARAGPTPPWPCNPWYDLKAFRWWTAVGRQRCGEAVQWNIG
jgi:hypothetical protein